MFNLVHPYFKVNQINNLTKINFYLKKILIFVVYFRFVMH
jgi:hypothetical protein